MAAAEKDEQEVAEVANAPGKNGKMTAVEDKEFTLSPLNKRATSSAGNQNVGQADGSPEDAPVVAFPCHRVTLAPLRALK